MAAPDLRASDTTSLHAAPTMSGRWLSTSLQTLSAEALGPLLVTSLVGVWVWAVGVIFVHDPAVPYAYAAVAVALAAAAISHRYRETRTLLAISAYMAGLITVLTLVALAFPGLPTLCLFTLAMVIIASLNDARVLVVGAAACVGAMSLVVAATDVSIRDFVVAGLLLALTGFSAWLGSRRLFTALGWAFAMTAEAQRSAADARWHRGEVQRVLKNLDEAYVRLEHANQALVLARDAAEKALRFKSDFVVNVSHELRTPLNLIIGFSEMMATAPESYGGVSLPKEYRGDVIATYRSARHLADLINDVLDLSQIEAGRMPISKELSDLGEVVRESVSIVRGLIEARGLTCDMQIPNDLPLVNLDRKRIRQVLLNLLTNATRFTDRGFIRATITVPATAGGGAEVVVSVQDSGRGIPGEMLERAFEAFSQMHESQIRDGSGMGLAVSRQFVALHGGRMWIESEVGRGTSVYFTLPIDDVRPAAELSSPGFGAAGMRRRVLLLTDDGRALDLVRRYVDEVDFIALDHFEEALHALDREAPAAVLIDRQWAVRAGVPHETIAARTSAPVLLMSLPGTGLLAMQLGVSNYLTKPVTRDALLRGLERLRRPIRHVLIADNDPHVVRLLARMVRADFPDVQVRETFDGDEALEALDMQPPDVLLLDLLMPQVSGYEVLQRMRDNSRLADVSVIIVSARGEEDEDMPVHGTVTIDRRGGYTATQMLRILGAVLRSLD